MSKIIRNLFLVFLLVVLMSINKSYGLNEDEEINLDSDTNYQDILDTSAPLSINPERSRRVDTSTSLRVDL